MKKIFYLLTIFSLVISSCNPLEDINKEIDTLNGENPIVGDATITLSDDNYKSLELSNSYFNNIDDAKNKLPAFIKNLYPTWGTGSSVTVNYELKSGSDLTEVAELTTSSTYRLTNDDYALTGSNAFGFYPDVNPIEKIPSVLDSQISSPQEGQIILTNYKQYTEIPQIGLASVVDYNFEGSFQGWAITDVTGNEGWTSESSYIQGNGYSGGRQTNEDWLISPEIDLSSATNLKFHIEQVVKYAGDFSLLKVLVAKDYTGDQTTATWEEINVVPTTNGNDFVVTDNYDFSAYEGEKINIALKYTSTTSDAGRWRIKNIAIKTLGVTGNTNNKGAYFKYESGNWKQIKDTYYLSSTDYNSMGENSGQPGRYDNFSRSALPNNYLPAFLANKYTFAQNGDKIYVYFKFYESGQGTSVKGNRFSFENGKWTPHQTSLQFGFENNKWVPDNTIKYTLTNADYALVGNDRYNNFDVRPGKPEYEESVREEKISTILLNNFPQYGEGQKFSVSYAVWKPGDDIFVMNVIHNGTKYVIK